MYVVNFRYQVTRNFLINAHHSRLARHPDAGDNKEQFLVRKPWKTEEVYVTSICYRVGSVEWTAVWWCSLAFFDVCRSVMTLLDNLVPRYTDIKIAISTDKDVGLDLVADKWNRIRVETPEMYYFWHTERMLKRITRLISIVSRLLYIVYSDCFLRSMQKQDDCLPLTPPNPTPHPFRRHSDNIETCIA